MDCRVFVLLHVVIPSLRKLLKLLSLDRFDLNELFPLLLFHAIALASKLVVTQLFELILSTLCLDVVELLLRLLEIVFQ